MTDQIYCPQVNAPRIFCVACDAEEEEVVQWLVDNPGGSGEPDGACCLEQLQGEPLTFTNRGVRATWDLFDEDPLPQDVHPAMSNKNRRYFCYSATIKFLGGTGGRVKLPDCVDSKARRTTHAIQLNRLWGSSPELCSGLVFLFTLERDNQITCRIITRFSLFFIWGLARL